MVKTQEKKKGQFVKDSKLNKKKKIKSPQSQRLKTQQQKSKHYNHTTPTHMVKDSKLNKNFKRL